MGQFSVKTYNPPGSLLSATQQAKVQPARGACDVALRKQGLKRHEKSEIEVPGIHRVDNNT